jgi:hypothetical protein
MLTKKRSFRPPSILVNGHTVPVMRTMRYIGVHLDTRLSFTEHARIVSAGVKSAATAIGRLMPNIKCPSQSKRQLLMSVVHSRLLNGVQVWSDSIQEVQKTKDALMQAQRIVALRVARCYRTVSDLVVLLLACMPPVPLLAAKRKRAAVAKDSSTPLSRGILRAEVIHHWHTMWDATSKASWTRRLIPDVSKWWYYGPKSVTFHMSQALSGHGCFQKYLHSRNKSHSPECIHCSASLDDAEHTIFDCPF